jgi:hypothetical protein
MSDLNNLIKQSYFKNYNFVNEKLTELIKTTVINMFPRLNNSDINILIKLTSFCIEVISIKFNFKNHHNDFYLQWEQNNCKDIKGVILLLLPFVNDTLLAMLTDLNHLIYSYPSNNINKDILKYKRKDILSSHFKYGNMSLTLLDKENENLLDMYNENNKIIYHIIHQNLLGLLSTLEIMNGKYYINWINIVPLNLNNYKSSDLYINTIAKINSGKKNLYKFTGNMLFYNGLWLGDIYNVLRIRFYDNIIKIKWLIFPYESDDGKYYLIQELDNILDLNNILKLNYNDYINLPSYEQNKFYDKINDITNKYINNSEIIKYCLLYFVNNSNIKSTSNIIKLFKISHEEDINNDDFNIIDKEQISNITYNNIINCLNYIKSGFIREFWNYLKYVLELFKKSAFGKYLIIDNQINHEYYNYKSLTDNTIYNINLKNIYNVAKSLSHTNLESWELLSDNYVSLSDDEKQNFFDKIYSEKYEYYQNWINLRNNFRLQNIATEDYDYNTLIMNLLEIFKEIYIDLIFEDLIVLGLLNKFVPNIDITDRSKYPTNTLVMKKLKKQNIYKLFNDNKLSWLESYYYLTNTQFNSLPQIKVIKESINPLDKYNEMSYFDIVALNQEWTTLYAMDWISQISFFKHYLYHQVLYVTGAPGQGKSTQVPKLLLYANHVINYKISGKIICTQPRIPPTVEISSRIAEELGVPIFKLSNYTINKLDTNNYYVQYKHQNNSHLNEKAIHSYLKLVTDGTLFEELNNNITMFEKIDDKFINKTKYDIIIVDEAHEHNTNMDMILTLARQTCYFNNKVKLVIMSATMDYDEPIYRIFYKNINDMLMYPIKNIFIKHPILNVKTKIEPIYMDRRYHISPPGETTQYTITEVYINEPITELDDKKSAMLAQEMGYNKIIEICNKTLSGEILFFANGKKEITDAVQYLNIHMPEGNVALPYYSELHDNYKDIIPKINIKIKSIKNKRENIYLEWGPEFIVDENVPNNIYKRAVIIATNVAEASITLDSLKYVVDNGYAKVNVYNPIINKTTLTVEKISESSRIQRKGRVGRVNDGTVYYMYNKGARENIESKYKITQENNTMMIMNLLCDKSLINSDNNKIIISDIYDPHNYELAILETEPKFKFKKTINIEDTYVITSGLYDIYLKNFKLQEKDYYIISNSKWYYLLNEKQLLYNLLDKNGEFYLIHFYENKITRNILNEIISYNDKKDIIINDCYYNNIILDLSTKYMLLNVNFYTHTDILYYNNDYEYYKTELANYLILIMNKMSVSVNNALSLFCASAMNCHVEVYELIVLLELLNYDISNIFNKKKINKIYTHNKSDIIFLYNIIFEFKKDFNNLMIFNIDINFLKYKCYEILKKYNKDTFTQDLNPELWNKLNNLKNSSDNILDYEKIILTSNDIYILFENDINKNKNNIIKWSTNKYFNDNIILSFITKLTKSYLKLISLENNDMFYNLNYAKEFSNNFNRILTDYNINEKIIRSFMYGYPLQFAQRDSNNNIITILNNKHNINPNITTLTNISHNIIFYLNYTEEGNNLNISIISEINSQWILSAFPLLFSLKNINTNMNIFLKKNLLNNKSKQNYIWTNKLFPILNYVYKKIN